MATLSPNHCARISKSPVTVEEMHDLGIIPRDGPVSFASTKQIRDRLSLYWGDVTTVDGISAVVNAAHSSLAQGSGICAAIFDKAGSTALRNELRRFNVPVDAGTAVTTSGHRLKANHIIHAVGPDFRIPSIELSQHYVALFNCYTNILEECYEHEITSVAIPPISIGIFKGDKDKCADTAVRAVVRFLLREENRDLDISVRFVVWEPKSPRDISTQQRLLQPYLNAFGTYTPRL
ncbi:hypothetical protein FPOAC2_10385 [Fusarium poae]|jgi:O-acetyl-ADP-ribose deacetylase (regulator of RNase III)|uniref:uncharacterized protein n=1 Tax=Fusarium poae TaxID=36050 RepID=UPI001CEB918A|nr:uncharacterized protein FPOAC1_013461 [Fusarium poae]XP_044714357.1 hypothetical protein FPOAC1_003886 [Fusarium poae]KAG8664681.1 hypothetical protein FPOAC1_013461 [Fusarium poae]KAG8677858.1 hypothetical protein FPOAC1_003886 [Fusarium poae]